MGKQSIILNLSVKTLRKAEILAARRAKSVNDFLADQLEILVDFDEASGQKAYDQAPWQALAFLDQGFNLGGTIRIRREEWHER